MLLTTKGRYAVAAVLELVQSSNNSPVKLATIAQKQNIPLNYLEQIFVKLRKAHIVKSTVLNGLLILLSVFNFIKKSYVIKKCACMKFTNILLY